VTYAFSLYAQGRTADGIAILNKIDPKRLADPHAAAYASVLLIDDNQFDAAKSHLEVATKGELFPEEKKLLDEAVAKIFTPVPSPDPSSPGPETPIMPPEPTPSPAT
jgi:hypothetical protein